LAEQVGLELESHYSLLPENLYVRHLMDHRACIWIPHEKQVHQRKGNVDSIALHLLLKIAGHLNVCSVGNLASHSKLSQRIHTLYYENLLTNQHTTLLVVR